MLLGGRAGQRLEPVRVVRGALLHRPLLHRLGDRVGERGVERLAAARASAAAPCRRAWAGGGAGRQAEKTFAPKTWLSASVRSGEPSAEPLALHCAAVTFCWRVLWHERDRFLLGKGSGGSARSRRAAREPKAIVVPSSPKGITGWRNRGRDLSTAGQTPLAPARSAARRLAARRRALERAGRTTFAACAGIDARRPCGSVRGRSATDEAARRRGRPSAAARLRLAGEAGGDDVVDRVQAGLDRRSPSRRRCCVRPGAQRARAPRC